MITDSLIWSHLQQTLRVNQTCCWYCRLLCRLLSTIASCSSRQLQVNWISSARILSFRPRHSVDCNSCSATIFNFFVVYNVNDDACWWTLTRGDFVTREICSLIQQFTMRITLRCTLSQSVLPGYRCVQHDMLRTKRDLTNTAGNKLWSGSEPWYRNVYRAQADNQGLRITRNNQLWPIRYIRRVAQAGRKTTKTPRRQQPLNVCNQYVTLPISTRVQCVSEEQSR